MNEPTTPRQIGQWLGKLTAQIGELVRQLAEADLEAAQAKAAYDLACAVAFRQASGSVEARRHHVTELTHGRRLAAEEAACRVRDLKSQIRLLETRIDVGRSYGAALRAEASAINTPWMEG